MESSNQPREEQQPSESTQSQVRTEEQQQQHQQQEQHQPEEPHEQVINENDKNEVQVNFKTGEQIEASLNTSQSREESESTPSVLPDVLSNETNEENARQEQEESETKPSISESTVFLTTSQFSEETTSDFELGVKDGNREHLVLNAYSESSSESPSASESPSNLSSSNPTSPTTVILNDQQPDLEATNHESQVEATFDDNNKVSIQELTSINSEQVTQQTDEDDLDKEYEIPTFNQSKSNENFDEMSRTEQTGLNLNALNEQIEALKQQIEEDQQQVVQQTTEQVEQKQEENKTRNIEDEKFVKILGNDTLQKRITQYGVEDSRPTNGQMVTISYEAYLHNDQQKLVDYSENYSFVLGDGDVISGLDMVVSLMNRDEKCEMIVEARLAYGSLGK